MTNEKDRVSLGELVRARRLEVGIATGRALADASQISTRTLNDIENGRRPSYSRATLWALDRALGWTRGSAQAVLDGGEPTLEPLGSGQSAASRSSTRTSRPALVPGHRERQGRHSARERRGGSERGRAG
ncbi:helix-turn-helix domain-containing protein [Actinomyces provencensis]|uniref:helix-turn-helix domain-containing protein n=1 Tax=Actinomyces provencensis TaxID=1720198 RepID=UPI00096A6B25